MTSNLTVRLFGKHSNRTPLAYASYSQSLRRLGIHLVDRNFKSPDIMLTGFHVDIAQNIGEIREVRKKNPDCAILVVSEEPLWDTLWSSQHISKTESVCAQTGDVFYSLNHFNSDIFSHGTVPYFLTTDPKYVARYVMLLSAHENMTPQSLLSHWANCEYEFSCFVEKRESETFRNKSSGRCLSAFRTDLVETLLRENTSRQVLLEGKGWKNEVARQSLPDWHADKLSKINRKSTFTLGIENTIAPWYVTEKVFDSYSTLSIPIICEFQNAILAASVTQSSLIIDPTRSDYMEKIRNFDITVEFAGRYLETMAILKRIFRSAEEIQRSTNSYAQKIAKAIHRLRA